jgi:hypothetical protein
MTLDDVRRRMRLYPPDDPTQCRADRDWLVGQLEEALADLAALRRALRDVEQLAREAADAGFAAAGLARMVRLDDGLVVRAGGGS